MRYETSHNYRLHEVQNVNKFFRAVALEKEKLRKISSTYQRRSVHFYSSVHFYRSCWICRKVWKWLHREVHYKITEQRYVITRAKLKSITICSKYGYLKKFIDFVIHWKYISCVIRIVPKSNASVKYETYLF